MIFINFLMSIINYFIIPTVKHGLLKQKVGCVTFFLTFVLPQVDPIQQNFY